MGTESTQDNHSEAEQDGEDESDIDEESVLSYLTNDGANMDNHVLEDTAGRNMNVDNTDSLPGSDDLRGTGGYRGSITPPTANPAVLDVEGINEDILRRVTVCPSLLLTFLLLLCTYIY